MKEELRTLFDEHLEVVLAELPQQVKDFMKAVPLYVEDYPSEDVLRRTGIRNRANLLGLYTGIPLLNRSINDWGVISDAIHIYRLGIMTHTRKRDGEFDTDELRNQIRRTILHEYGHHVGLTERDLHELGYG